MLLNDILPSTVSTVVRGEETNDEVIFFLTTNAVTPLWLCRPVLLNGLSMVYSCPLKQHQISFGVSESTGSEVMWGMFCLIGLLASALRGNMVRKLFPQEQVETLSGYLRACTVSKTLQLVLRQFRWMNSTRKERPCPLFYCRVNF